ncbi:hypothetical protein C0993_005588 [Termitomyces sp. T159_Od127]|nr:hypothetical protein C0993_005588 [Termitomyces sp. T159_Od127]
MTITGIKVEEWAADWIVAHNETGKNAMFEVLWTAGDKTWMSYEQANELNLLDPYLELLRVEDIHHLVDRLGSPLNNDPQTYLGLISINKINTCLEASTTELPKLPPSTQPSITTLEFNSTQFLIHHNMGYKGHQGSNILIDDQPDSHPYVQQNLLNLIIMIRDEAQPEKEAMCIHPLQLSLIIQYDDHVRISHGQPTCARPTGYDEVAKWLKSADPHKCPY